MSCDNTATAVRSIKKEKQHNLLQQNAAPLNAHKSITLEVGRLKLANSKQLKQWSNKSKKSD